MHRVADQASPADILEGPKMIRHLAERLPDINAKDYCGSTPLHMAMRRGNVSVATALVDLGADINSLDHEGDGPINDAIFANWNDLTELLLRRGPPGYTTNVYGNNILHMVALYGDLGTVKVVDAAKLQGIDTEARNERGLTACEEARERSPKPIGFDGLCMKLLDSIRSRNEAGDQGDEDRMTSEHGLIENSANAFVDARECQ